MNHIEIDFSKSKELEKRMAMIPDRSEELVNQVLKQKGTKQMMQSIISFMPVSKKKKVHAKESNSLRATMKNLGFIVTTRGGAANRPGSFGYLVFPNEGRGPHNHVAQEFFERGGDAASDPILDQVIDALDKAHDELLGTFFK